VHRATGGDILTRPIFSVLESGADPDDLTRGRGVGFGDEVPLRTGEGLRGALPRNKLDFSLERM